MFKPVKFFGRVIIKQPLGTIRSIGKVPGPH